MNKGFSYLGWRWRVASCAGMVIVTGANLGSFFARNIEYGRLSGDFVVSWLMQATLLGGLFVIANAIFAVRRTVARAGRDIVVTGVRQPLVQMINLHFDLMAPVGVAWLILWLAISFENAFGDLSEWIACFLLSLLALGVISSLGYFLAARLPVFVALPIGLALAYTLPLSLTSLQIDYSGFSISWLSPGFGTYVSDIPSSIWFAAVSIWFLGISGTLISISAKLIHWHQSVTRFMLAALGACALGILLLWTLAT